MNRTLKLGSKILAVFLAVATFICVLPMNVFAEEANKNTAVLNRLEAKTTDIEQSAIVSEIISKRDQYTKVFLRADGSETAVFSGMPLHYVKNNEWIDIDNTLEEKTLNGKSILQNKEGAFTVSLPSDLANNNMISVKNKGYTLSFGLQSEQLQGNLETVQAQIRQPMDSVGAQETQTEIDETQKANVPESSNAYAAAGLDTKESAVLFENVEKNTDLQYVINPTGLKENIILNEQPEGGITYTYSICTNGLIPVLNEDNSVDFKDGSGNMIFILPAPFMYDTKNEISHEVAVSLSGTDSSYTMTYTPSVSWLSDDARAYPIILDPVIETPVGQSKIIDSMVASSEPTVNYGGDSMGLLGQYSGDICRMYYGLSSNVDLNLKSTTVVNAKFYVGGYTTNKTMISANPVSHTWAENTITYSYMQNLSDISMSSNINTLLYDYDITNASENTVMSFDITKAFFNIQNISSFHGIMLKAYDESIEDVPLVLTSEYTTDTSLCPVFEISYRLVNNMDNVCDTFALPAGRAGTMYMNQFSTDVYINNDIIGIDGEAAPVFINFHYNSVFYKRYIASTSSQECYGKGWLTNYNQYLLLTSSLLGDSVEYCNEYGDIITMFYNSEDTNYFIYNDLEEVGNSGLKMYVYKQSGSDYIAFIEKEDGIKLYFDFNFRLAKIDDMNGKSSFVEYMNNNDIPTGGLMIKKIIDGANREYRFTYNSSNRLVSINCYNNISGQGYVQTTVPEGSSNVYLLRSFTYNSSGYLTGITYPDGKTVDYTYTSSSVQMRNIDGYALEYQVYASESSYKISEKYFTTPSTYTLGNTVTEIKSGNYSRDLEYRYGESVNKLFDKYGRTVCTTDSSDEYANLSYTNNYVGGSTESELVGPVGITYLSSGTNLVQNGDFESGTDDWDLSLSSDTDVYDLPMGNRIDMLGESALNIRGSIDDFQTVFQTITPTDSGNAGDGYTLSAWGLSHFALPTTDDYKSFNIFVCAYITDENSEHYEELIDVAKLTFNPYITGWQGLKTHFTIEEQYSDIVVFISYINQICPENVGTDYQTYTASFDGIELVKTFSATSTTENPGSGSDPEVSDPNYEITEDNGTTTFSMGDGDSEMNMSKTVSGNYLSNITDYNGISNSYNYNQSNGLLNSLTRGVDSTETYAYNSMGYITQVSQNVSGLANNQTAMTTQYGYTNDRLTSITHNSFTYNFEYDIWGNKTAVKLGDQMLVSYTYGEGISRDKLNTITYANGDTISYFYNINGNVTDIVKNNAQLPSYTYDYTDGSLTSVTDSESGLTTSYTDDGISIYSGNTLVYSSLTDTNENDQTVVTESFAGQMYTHTATGNTTNVDTGKKTSTSTLTGYGENDFTLSSVTDYFGRADSSSITQKIEETDAYKYEVETKNSYTYQTLSNNATSGLVEKYGTERNAIITIKDEAPFLLEDPEFPYHTGDVITENGSSSALYYTYDGKGNITREYTLDENEVEVSRYDYTYDEAGQLVRVDDAIRNQSFTYTYDMGGNIVSKKEYAYTTGTLGTVVDTIDYTYNSTWKDKLVSYDGSSIGYDSMGNPTNYVGQDYTGDDTSGTLQYNGRQLVKATQGYNGYEYIYNESGLMTKKLVYNDVTTDANGNLVFDNLSMTYTYYWNGTTLVGYTASNGIEMFSVKVIYGDDGDPDGFTVTDSSEEQFTYFYTKNLQGDITGILTANGDDCVTLDYDAYGLPSFTITGNTAQAIVALAFTPFLYRGYMYDHDTGLYYLQSRFYNPLYGRFLNADEMNILESEQGEVFGANLFMYCLNNPVNYIDESGHVPALVVLQIIIVIIVLILIIKFFFGLDKTYKELRETLRVHTKNVLEVGIYNNYNVDLQAFEYFDSDDNSNNDYIDQCKIAYNNMINDGLLSSLNITDSYTNDDVNYLSSSILLWDRFTCINIIILYLKKMILGGYVELFTF